MRLARPVIAAGLAVAVAALTPAHAAGKRTISKTYAYRDATPDPTGYANGGNELHCDGKLPAEPGIKFKVPAPGKLSVELGGFSGDWSLQIRDGKGNVVGGDDVNPPAYESVTLKVKKAQTMLIRPCNFSGTFDATVKVVFKYA